MTTNENGKLPEHIALIMDGNGRWAAKFGKPRTEGHKKGAKTLEHICDEVKKLGIKYITVYAFSTENWDRPKSEVDYLMKLLRKFLIKNKKDAMKKDVRIRVIGDLKRLDLDLQNKVRDIETATENNKSLNLQLAINYGSRDEMIRGLKEIITDIGEKKIAIEDIDESLFDKYLDTKNIPNPDFMIRTSGEKRLSNFLLWQLAYSELYFTDTLWPDFTVKELNHALEQYKLRNRRFGAVSEEE